MRPIRVALASLLVVTLSTPMIVAIPGAAHADEPAAANGKPSAADVEEAKKHYARGVALYNQRADAAARAELERAYALAPNWKVLYNLGLVELQMNDFASALRSFERYLEAGGNALGAARQREVVGRVAMLREEVATLDVKVNAEGAEVLLDDLAIGTSPLARPIVVNPGHYKLSASKGGHSAESKAVNVTGGDHAVVELAIEEPAPIPATAAPLPAPTTPIPSPAPAEPTPPPIDVKPAPPEMPDPNAAKKRAEARLLWIGWGTTGALAAGAAVTGIVALGANSDLTHAKRDRPASSAELDHLSSRAHTFAAVSDALTVGAIAAAGVSLYLTLRSNHAWSASPTSPAAASRRSTGPMGSVDVALGPASFAVYGTF